MTTLPQPPGWHLARWARDPLRLLEDGARTSEVFALRLWRPVVVGHRPDWNRAVLGDLGTFRSKGSLSGLTPYLSGGVVGTDAPRHRDRRRGAEPDLPQPGRRRPGRADADRGGAEPAWR